MPISSSLSVLTPISSKMNPLLDSNVVYGSKLVAYFVDFADNGEIWFAVTFTMDFSFSSTFLECVSPS